MVVGSSPTAGATLSRYDAIVVGSGPNGLAAAITLLRSGRSVLVLEGAPEIGGGMRSEELTLPGFIHDWCSAIHPLALASPFFRSVDLAAAGLQWTFAPIQYAHTINAEHSAVVYQSMEQTSVALGVDGPAYRRLFGPLVDHWRPIVDGVLAPLRVPRHPLALARFARFGLQPALRLANTHFRADGRALIAGAAAHSELPLTYPTTAGTALLLGLLAHAVGWPMVRGGSQRLADALGAIVKGLGGEILTDVPVASLDDLPPSRDVLLDLTPSQILRLGGTHLSPAYGEQLRRFRYGPGIFKLDYALRGPIPWRDPLLQLAGTVHVGGSAHEVAAAEGAIACGQYPEKPLLLVAQQSLFDSSRVPSSGQTAWLYGHVPNGSTRDMTTVYEDRLEEFAPGFRDLILARRATTPVEFERHNPNYVGGDISGGAMTLRQLFTRPAIRLNPYTTPNPHLFLCSSSTPPGPGVHGMCGYWAARTVINRASRGHGS